ncbi:MAG: DUF5330 domain-containing protein [Hyphomicrobiaceae bacterium]
MYQTASYAVHRAATFCDRNASVCESAENYWAIFKEKAAVGARMLGDLINERLAGSGPARGPSSTAPPTSPLLERSEPRGDTLLPSDRRPEWRSHSHGRVQL